MKRDCGTGELIPTSFSVVYSSGFSDEEVEKDFTNKDDALVEWNRTADALVRKEKGSDVRLYAIDKQGYANCIKMLIHTAQGQLNETDRSSEL